MPRFNPLRLMNENKAVMGLNLLHWWDERGSLEEVTARWSSCSSRARSSPVVAEAFPFDRAADAHRFIQERKNIGKVVLTPVVASLPRDARRRTRQLPSPHRQPPLGVQAPSHSSSSFSSPFGGNSEVAGPARTAQQE